MKEKIDNELIAEFMGYVKKPDSYLWLMPTPKENYVKDSRDFAFNSSWDWLMPVVEKIDGMGYHVTIMRTRTIIAITLNVQNHIQSIHPGYSMIEVCYQAVVEFVKWYNRQKEK